ncbi:MAG: GNAT family N-acetyltransferase [Eubacteriales bacterium]|nr:GNAT family N-acetyltransferase [Eubacteriales bacterium]
MAAGAALPEAAGSGRLWELLPESEGAERWVSETALLERRIFGSSAWPEESFRKAAENVYDSLFLYTGTTGTGTGSGGACGTERLLGYALIRQLDVAELLIIGVSEDARRQGIGAALMKKVLSAAGCLPVFLEVREGNAAARRLYETCGFREYGRRKNYYEHPSEDAVLMKYEDIINA